MGILSRLAAMDGRSNAREGVVGGEKYLFIRPLVIKLFDPEFMLINCRMLIMKLTDQSN
jgi:hypothetical protein